MLRFPPPLWAMLYVAAAALASWALAWPGPSFLPQPMLGAALVAARFVPPVWAVLLFRRAGTELQPTSAANRALVTDGPFRFTRNPMYLGLVIITLGIAIGVGAWPMVLAPVAVFLTANFVHIPFEEAKMRRQFGADFDAFARRTRRWI